jgi:succinate dehydrogenase/fumarate reductase-like Fe-S protein
VTDATAVAVDVVSDALRVARGSQEAMEHAREYARCVRDEAFKVEDAVGPVGSHGIGAEATHTAMEFIAEARRAEAAVREAVWAVEDAYKAARAVEDIVLAAKEEAL